MTHLNRLHALSETYNLTQARLSSLIGRAESSIGSYVRGEKLPQLAPAIALELIFGKWLHQLYPELACLEAERILAILQAWSIEIEGQNSPGATVQRTLISMIGERISAICPTL